MLQELLFTKVSLFRKFAGVIWVTEVIRVIDVRVTRVMGVINEILKGYRSS